VKEYQSYLSALNEVSWK